MYDCKKYSLKYVQHELSQKIMHNGNNNYIYHFYKADTLKLFFRNSGLD